MDVYLRAQGADLLAVHFLNADAEGSMINYVMNNIGFGTQWDKGLSSYSLTAPDSLGARVQLMEGVLTALFLVRAHQVAQATKEADFTIPPPEAFSSPDV
jgi:hypothetical protein